MGVFLSCYNYFNMNQEELIEKCLIDKDAIVTYPFKDKHHQNTPILRHKSNNKWFGVIFEQNGTLFINLKAPPDTIWALKDQYPQSIFPAWHMNKKHWFKVNVNSIEPDVLDTIIKISFNITNSKMKNI